MRIPINEYFMNLFKDGLRVSYKKILTPICESSRKIEKSHLIGTIGYHNGCDNMI